jgi:hypothetical protein
MSPAPPRWHPDRGLASRQRRHDPLDESSALLGRQQCRGGDQLGEFDVSQIEQRRTHHFSPLGFPS